MIKICYYCQKEFKTDIKRRKYCNHQCEKLQYFKEHPQLYRSKKWFEEKYYKEKLSYDAIAKLCNAGHTAVYKFGKKFGIKSRPQPAKGNAVGKDNPSWKGGRYEDNYGYVHIYAPDYPGIKKSGVYVREHAYILWKRTGKVFDGMTIHHKNGVRNDNRLENLQIFPSQSRHRNYEEIINSFGKQLLWGEILKSPKLKKQLLLLFNEFSKKSNKLL